MINLNWLSNKFNLIVNAQTPEEIIGGIDAPPGVDIISARPEAGEIGIFLFFSNLTLGIIILGGIWTFANIVLAAYAYITGGGNPDSHTKVRDRLSMSLIGLLLMVGAYTLTGLIGLIFFGDASYILNPTLESIGGTN
jgi:hypothetical protein